MRKSINLTFIDGSTRFIAGVKEHQYMSTSGTLKVITEGRTFYHPLRNLLEIEISYGK